MAHGEAGEVMQQMRGHGVEGVRQTGADDGFERAFESGADLVVEDAVFDLAGAERDEFAPLLAGGEHVGEEVFAVGEVGVAMQEDGAQGLMESFVGTTKFQQGAASGEAIERTRILHGLARAGAGEQREGVGDLGADGVNRADVEPLGPFEQVPVEAARALEDRGSKAVGGAVEVGGVCGELRLRVRGVQVMQHALEELGGGLLGEGDGEDLFGLMNVRFGEELEQALDEKAGFAGAGGGFDDAGGADVER
jgi:hypothetical protein